VSYLELFAKHNPGVDYFDEAQIVERAKELGVYNPEMPVAKIANDVFEETCEKHLDGPAFLYDYPKDICPFAKAKDDDPKIAERFELFLAGMELGNAFTELNDPIDQEKRLEEQVESKDDETPGEVDYDYVSALEYGLPPAGGLGIGIDRLVMVLLNKDSIRDVVLFPLLRQQDKSVDPDTDAAESGEAAES
jgi:lysyl-tRNA synthetase class 2